MIWLGTISAAMITTNTAFFPGNLRKTRPYALSTPSTNFDTPSTPVTMTELRRKVQNGTDVVASP